MLEAIDWRDGYMKKLLVLLLIIFVSIFSAVAVDVTGRGIGSTEDEALRMAREDLISQFSINVSSLTYTQDSDDGVSSSSSSMASYSLQSTQFNLLGRVENVEENSDGSYTATCTIPSSAAPLYEAQLNNLYSTINSLYSQVDGKEGQRNTYLRLITALRDYEIYQTVVLTLNPSSSVATKVLPTTRAIIENEYQSLLIIENNNTEITVRNLQQQAEMGILSVQGRADLNAALKELEENRRQQEELNAMAQEDYDLQREAFQQEMAATAAMLHESLSSYSTGNAVSGEMTFSDLINQIEANRATLQAIKDSTNESLAKLDSEFNEEVERKRSDILYAPWSSNELYNGQPTRDAREFRNQSLEVAIEELRSAYSQEANIIYGEAFNRMSSLTNYTFSYVDELNGKTFLINSFAPEVSTEIDMFAEAAGVFSGIATVTIGNSSTELYFRIPYEAWTGEKIPSRNDFQAYSLYRDTAADWLKIMQDFPEIFSIEFAFTITNDYSSTYNIIFRNYTITRNDTGEVVFSDSINQKDSLEYPSRTRLNDFTVTSGDLVDYDQFVYKRGDVDLNIEVANETEYVEPSHYEEPAVEEDKQYDSNNRGILDGDTLFNIYGSGLWNKTGFSTAAAGIKYVNEVSTFTWGINGKWLFDMSAPFEVGRGYVGPSLNVFVKLLRSMYMYIDVSAGIGSWFGPGLNGNIFFGATADAGFYISLTPLLALDISGDVSWLDNNLYYGANVGIAFAL